MNYPHKIQPFAHQREHLESKWDAPTWALFWEQGTAKTKPIIDTAAMLYMEGKINGLLVVAPPGVERNWLTDEVPKHLPFEVAVDTMDEVFLSAKKDNKSHKALMKKLIEHEGLSIMLISYSAFMTKLGKKTVWEFLKNRDCLYVLDESHHVKTPNAKRTKSIIASGRYAKFKRILTGTPITNQPFDLYSQMKFLNENFWKPRGIGTAAEFRNFFGIYKTREDAIVELGYDPGYDQLLDYRNLHLLEEWIAEVSNRVLKDDILDLPPKLYSKRYFDLNKEQMDVYEELKEKMFYEFEDGEMVSSELPVTKLLRFQQVTCGYLPVGEESLDYRLISKVNPRLKIMEELRDITPHPAIIWARFRHDVDQLMDLFGDEAVRYDGEISDDEAERSKMAFQSGDAQWFIGTTAKGAEGLTLTQAKTIYYYSNNFNLTQRLQSEDRAHRPGMDENPVNIVDIVAANVEIDNKIVDNLRGKKEISSEVLGDKWKQWI